MPDDMSMEVSRLTELVCLTPCSLHDAQNAFRWAFFTESSNTQLMRDVYVSIESLRNSCDLLERYLNHWISLRLRLVPARSAEWVSAREELWHALGIEPDPAAVLAEQLHFSFEDGCICVKEHSEHSLDLVGAISAALLACWRFKKLTTSRWLIVGTSSRTVTAALLTGMPDLVKYIQKESSSGLFFLNGWDRLKAEGKRFVVQAAMGSRVSEGFLSELMDDPRVALRLPELWQAAGEEMRWLIDVSDDVWKVLGPVCGMRADRLRDRCVAAGHVSFHFLWRRVLHPATNLPWRLVRGDIGGNLEQLKDGPCPQEPVSSQLWHLLHMGYPIVPLINTVRLIGEASWSSLPAEQQHGSLAIFKRWHPEYGTGSLLTRAFMMQLSRLLPAQAADEKKVASITRKLGKIDASQPGKATGRHTFLKGLIAAVRSRKERGDERYAESTFGDLSKHWFSRHAKMWAQQSLRMQLAFLLRARRAAGSKRAALEQERASLSSQLDLLNDKIEDSRAVLGPICMSAAALDDDDLDCFMRLMHEPSFRRAHKTDDGRPGICKSPAPWSQPYVAELGRHPTWSWQEPKQPNWATAIVQHREFFAGCGLLVSRASGDEWYKIVYMVKNPVYLALCPMQEVSVVRPDLPSDATVWQIEESFERTRWRCNYGNMTTAADIPDAQPSEIYVAPCLKHIGGIIITTSWEPIPYRLFLGGEEMVAQGQGEVVVAHAPKHQEDTSHWDDMMDQFPWLQHLDAKEAFGTGFNKPKSSAASSSGQDKLEALEEAEPDEDAVLEGLALLDKARAAIEEGNHEHVDHLHCKTRHSTEAIRAGRGPDAVQAMCTTAIAREWCKRRKLQVTFKATFTMYGMDVASVLTRAWCHRMQFFLEQELDSENAGLLYTDDDIAKYQEPMELKELAKRMLKPAVKERVTFIRHLPRVKA